jgi:hypothetical protein
MVVSCFSGAKFYVQDAQVIKAKDCQTRGRTRFSLPLKRVTTTE